MTETPLLTTRAIAKSYGPVVALRSVDLTVLPGETHALLGANGAGKSTLVKILSGVISADSGTVVVNGEEIRLGRPADATRSGLATVFQDPALIPDLTLTENFRLTQIDAMKVRTWLEQMDLGDLDFDHMVRDLPLAVLRLVDLARALALDPLLLMLDEITAALSADQALHVSRVMKQWTERNRSVLFISHRLTEVLELCDSATILRNGTDVVSLDPSEGGEERLVAAMLGEVADQPPAEEVRLRRADASSPVLFESRHLSRGEKVTDVSFQLHRGEILGIAALEGQGQDELFQVLSGDRKPDAGEILVGGDRLTARSPYDAIRKGVVLVPADRLHALLPQRSVRENLATPLYNRLARWLRLMRDEDTRVDNAIARLDIDVRAQSQARRLSGGNQQKLTIGRWLTASFGVLLCFDPTRGIDIQTKAQIYALLRELADEGAAILLYTSELREIPLVCDRVLVMYDGAVVDEQPAASATEQSLLTAAHGLQQEAS